MRSRQSNYNWIGSDYGLWIVRLTKSDSIIGNTDLAMVVHQRAMRLSQTDPANWAIPIKLQAPNYNFATLHSAPPSYSGSSSKRPQADISTSSPQGHVCGNWNAGRPCFKLPCSYQHLCKACGGNHVKKDCKGSP